MEVVVTTGAIAIRRAKLKSNRYHQPTSSLFTGRVRKTRVFFLQKKPNPLGFFLKPVSPQKNGLFKKSHLSGFWGRFIGL